MQAENIAFMEKENHHHSGRAGSPTMAGGEAQQQQSQQQQTHQYYHFNSSDNSINRYQEVETAHKENHNAYSNNNNYDWIEKTATIQQALVSLITKTSCRLCHVYTDKQLEFENRQALEQEQQRNSLVWNNNYPGVGYNGGSDHSFIPYAPAAATCLEVELYRQFLFDEESVVTSLSAREEEEVVVEEEEDERLEEEKQPQQLTQQQRHPLEL